VSGGSAADAFDAEWSVGVGLSLPRFTGGRLSGQIEEAQARESGAQQRVRLGEKAVERAVDRAYASISETAARVRSLERAVAAREEVVRIEKLRLETGTGIQTDYLDAEADLLTSRADLARMRFAALRARVELARATGALDPAWIERNLEAES
jgi:outer membrane protein TolC